ncbi:glutamate-1-semialdehyde 2,1-aminomutase [Aureliella helgolandensis]|uniref:Glutamate-1-semialdehyde 2,1-aminomutase n=1 Tax=Aureliella helgolandensis TaxID=2527968 RepID=A0A518G6X4_9BACT|nr:glutamate-1-semialdehyde 2,1-aminomutase [Aureliella helgolandensis]QDV24339.1 Glutamate-1-semialdehyde 2,1-aminomutase 2 [Aureliella helgolandensis]
MFKAPTVPFNQERSQAAFDRACEFMPGGVNSPARAFGAVGGKPLFIERADGPFLFDIDGNQFVDFIGSWGPMIMGHAHPKVVAAIQEAVAKGTSYGAPTERESQLAELITEAVPSIEKLRLVNSGTEATMSAIRLARGATGRDKVIKFSGNYHGHVDSLLVSAGSAAASLGVPDSPGVTKGTSSDTIVLEYNDVAALQSCFAEYGDQLACIILEPVVGNMGCVPPQPGFLQAARELCTKSGAVLIFDEVMTGFRVAWGGAQSLYGITPDLTTLGKIVGGGLPMGVYGGRKDLMDHVMPAGKVYQAGTLSGNPLATAAGVAMMQLLKEESPYAYLEQQAERLAQGLSAAATAAGLPHQVQRVGSMMTLFFSEQPVLSWTQANECHRERYAEYFWGMMRAGIYLPCSQFEALFFSSMHTPELMDHTIDAAHTVLGAMAAN